MNRSSVVGRVALDRRIQQIPDVLSDPEYGRQDVQQIVEFRTVMAAPMLLDDEVVGALSLVRTEVDPFDERAIALLEAFAAQAAIVVRNVHLCGSSRSAAPSSPARSSSSRRSARSARRSARAWCSTRCSRTSS